MSQAREQLTSEQLAELRQKNLIEAGEVAFIAGDLLIAENPVTSTRRVVGNTTMLAEASTRRILKG